MLRTYDVHQRDEGITLSLSHITNQSFAEHAFAEKRVHVGSTTILRSI